jgi:hypothetical protein
MNRFAVIVLSAAAVLGTTGGVAAATLHDRTGPTTATHGAASKTPTAAPTTDTPTPTPGPSSDDQPLLYAAGRTIHDGGRSIRFSGPHHVAQLARTRTGYVLAEPTSSQEAAFDLWTVRPDGTTDDFASVGGLWDLNADGTRVVGFDNQTGQMTVWDLATGNLVSTFSGSSDAVGNAGFAGHDVYVTRSSANNQYDVLRWDPDSGKVTKEPFIGFEQLTLSPGGSYMTGLVGREGINVDANTCLAVRSTYLKKSTVDWHSCDYRTDAQTGRFSPDGTRLLAVPAGTDPSGPIEYDVIDASDGPRRLVATIKAPKLTLGAEWAGDDSLYVYGSTRLDDPAQDHGTWIDRCTLDGTCTRLVTGSGKLVVASVL